MWRHEIERQHFCLIGEEYAIVGGPVAQEIAVVIRCRTFGWCHVHIGSERGLGSLTCLEFLYHASPRGLHRVTVRILEVAHDGVSAILSFGDYNLTINNRTELRIIRRIVLLTEGA